MSHRLQRRKVERTEYERKYDKYNKYDQRAHRAKTAAAQTQTAPIRIS
jgi:hypothetical protein